MVDTINYVMNYPTPFWYVLIEVLVICIGQTLICNQIEKRLDKAKRERKALYRCIEIIIESKEAVKKP